MPDPTRPADHSGANPAANPAVNPIGHLVDGGADGDTATPA